MYYGVGNYEINILSIVFYAIYVPGSPLGAWSVERLGLRRTLMIGCFLNFAGAGLAWMDALVQEPWKRYAFCMAGQVAASIGQPFIFNPISKVANGWFAPLERTTANSIMSLGQPIGAAIILQLAPLFVSDDYSKMPDLNLFLFVLAAVFGICVIWVEDSPKTPPAHSAEVKTLSFWEGSKRLVRNVPFLILFSLFSLYYGTFNVFSTLLSDYVHPWGYSEKQAGLLGMLSIVSGIVATLVIGPLVDKTQSHERVLKILVVLNAIASLLFYFGCQPDMYWLLLLASILSGISGSPLIPLVSTFTTMT